MRILLRNVATRGHFQVNYCVKIDFRRGSAPDPAGGAYSAPQTPLLDLRGPTPKRGEGGEVFSPKYRTLKLLLRANDDLCGTACNLCDTEGDDNDHDDCQWVTPSVITRKLYSVLVGVFTIGPLGPCPPP